MVTTCFLWLPFLPFSPHTSCRSPEHCPLPFEKFVSCAVRPVLHQPARGMYHHVPTWNTSSQPLALICLRCLFFRQFISSTYPVLKKHNPDLPILIREAKDTPARVFARYGTSGVMFQAHIFTPCCFRSLKERGVEKHVEVDNLSSTDVASKVAQLLSLS